MNIVIDTNVFVSALLSPDNKSFYILEKIFDGTYTLCYNEEILDEYKNVLSRKKFGIDKTKISYLVSFIRLKGIYILEHKKSSISFPDESDRVFYDIAMLSDAILITGNIKHFPKHKRIMTVATFYNRYLN